MTKDFPPHEEKHLKVAVTGNDPITGTLNANGWIAGGAATALTDLGIQWATPSAPTPPTPPQPPAHATTSTQQPHEAPATDPPP